MLLAAEYILGRINVLPIPIHFHPRNSGCSFEKTKWKPQKGAPDVSLGGIASSLVVALQGTLAEK